MDGAGKTYQFGKRKRRRRRRPRYFPSVESPQKFWMAQVLLIWLNLSSPKSSIAFSSNRIQRNSLRNRSRGVGHTWFGQTESRAVSNSLWWPSRLFCVEAPCSTRGFQHTGRLSTLLLATSNNYHDPSRSTRYRLKQKLSPARGQRNNNDTRRLWLDQATEAIIRENDLSLGKWHQAARLIFAWSRFRKVYGPTPLRMEALLKLLIAGRSTNPKIMIDLKIYNTILNAWTCAAIFRTVDAEFSHLACSRAKEILRILQQENMMPNEYSFDIVLHTVLRTEGALEARRLLAWMEYLYKTGKNHHAKPSSGDYIQILEAYAKLPSKQSGSLADGVLTHMEYLHENDGSMESPSTICYNIVLKAWSNARKYGLSGREVAEHADRILEQMKQRNLGSCRPDRFTFSSCISMWASSGMKSHAVNRVEQYLRDMDETDVEPNTVILNSVMRAYTQSRKAGAVERTAELLEIMENSPVEADLSPDLTSYNTHLHCLCINSSPQTPELAFEAELLLDKMLQRYFQRKLASRPNLFSYNLVLKAIVNTRSPDVAIRASRFLQKLTRQVKPDTVSFNRVLSAFALYRKPALEQKAHELLRYMEDSYHSGFYPKARPDATSYAYVIQAYANSDEDGAPDRAQALFNEMNDRYAMGAHHLKPNKECFVAVIESWAKSQTGTRGARQAEALLNQMIARFEAGERDLAPPLKIFNAILHAWAFSGTRGSGYQAEKYLHSMWAKFHSGKTSFRPNKVSYNTVIKAIAKSKNDRKAQKALKILRQMDRLYKTGNVDAPPGEWSYAAVLHSCASLSVEDSRIRRKALDTALFTLQELQNNSIYGKPTDFIYGTLLRACSILLDKDDELRSKTIRAVFQQCVTDGQVGHLVLRNTPREVYSELLPSGFRKESINFDDLPIDWRCNVRSASMG